MAFLKKVLKKSSGEKEWEERKEKRDTMHWSGNVRYERMVASALLLPRMTEKAAHAAGSGTYTFSVARDAGKKQIKEAVEARYQVGVAAVRVLNSPAKERRRGNQIGWKPGFKKAMITLKKGQRIEIQ